MGRPGVRGLTLLTLFAVGCGGNATDDKGDSEPDASGGYASTVIPDPDPDDPGAEDPLLDENFDAALQEALSESCRLQIECSGATQWGSEDECTEFFVDMVHTNFDVESRECRAAMLDAYECYNETWSCEEGDNCSAQELSGCLLRPDDGN